jgi:hypothetical protein
MLLQNNDSDTYVILQDLSVPVSVFAVGYPLTHKRKTTKSTSY